MLTVNAHENFTFCGDAEAEMLLKRVLYEIGEALSGTELCVVLGGSYGRGDGGVRQDRENGILYNDLDFFVFARSKNPEGVGLLKELAVRYEHELKVDVDFSAVMTVKDIKNNASRLMMQELKRGYHLVCGEDLLAEYLPEIPADKLPFSEACRLLVNRGMGLLFAGDKIVSNSDEMDFILRNIYKAILGAGDAVLIAQKIYFWNITERLEWIEKSDMLDDYKKLYRKAVEFKRAPHRTCEFDMLAFWHEVRDFFAAAMERCAGDKKRDDLKSGIYKRCCQDEETSIKNYAKYCIKTRTLPFGDLGYYLIPPVAALAGNVYSALGNKMPAKIDKQSKLYQHWLMFN